MLNQVLDYLNNYFTKVSLVQTSTGTLSERFYQYARDVSFTANDTITGDFEDTYIAGEYIRLEGTRLNDGVYLISANNNTSLTIDTTVKTIATEPEISTLITKCYIPSTLISLISDIETYVDNYTVDGVTSEKLGDYSISYGSSVTESGWQGAFAGKLRQYKKLGW